MTIPNGRLQLREKLAYGSGDLASCLFWNSFQYNLVLYYTDVFGLAAVALTPLFLFTRVFDGVTDLAVGSLADRTRTRWGRYRPFVLWYSLPLCVAGVMMFTTPDLGHVGKLIWAWVTYNAVMLLYTLVNIPYTALLGTISSHPKERATVSTFKFAGAFTGCIVVSYFFMPLTRDLSDGSPQRGWQMAFIVIALTALPFFLITFLGTRERVTPPPGQKTPLRRDLADLFRNKAWVVLLCITMAFVFFNAARSTVMNHYLKYVAIGGDGSGTVSVWFPFLGDAAWDFATLQSRFNTTGQFASLAGVILVGFFVKRMEKRWNLVFWWVVAAVATAWPYWLRPDQVEALVYLNMISSLAGGPTCVLIWAMYSDAAEYSEWKNGRQAAGLVFSASTFTQKVGWGLGPAVVTFFMGRIGFEPNVQQSPEVIRMFLISISLVPLVFAIVSAAFVFIYPLNDKMVEQMSADLKDRRGANGNGEAEAAAAPAG